MARKTKAQKEAEALELQEAEAKTEVQDEVDGQVDGQVDTEVETPSEEQSEVQDSSDADTSGEQPEKADVAVEEPEPEVIDTEADKKVKQPTKAQVKKAKASQPQEVFDVNKASKQNVTENPESAGIPIREVPIRHLPGFEVGSKRNMNDPHEVRMAREQLKAIRALHGDEE